VFYTIELLPQLLLRVSSSMTLSFEVSQPDGDVGDLSGTQYRHNVLAKFSDLDWPRRFFLQVLKNFRDFVFTPDEERAFCIKIYREAHKELNSSSDQVRRLEMFPTVCLSVLQLVGRTQSLLCTRLLTRLLINKCQQLTMDASEREDTVSSLNTRELRELQSTVLYHFEMALRQWERLGEAIRREYEQQSSQRLSSFDVALMLLVASHHKYEQSMMQLLLRHVVSTYTSKREGTSDGHQEAIARKAFLSVVQSAQDGNLSPIVHQMIELGFLLLEHRAVKVYHGDTQHAGSEGGIDMCNTPEWVDFGVRLLLACFQYHLPVRGRVMDRVVNMIIVQNANCRTYIYVMLRIVNRHIAELGGGLEARIRECLEYVTQLDPAHANYLLVALSPLLKTQHSLKEFVILVLRKAMFRKDEGSRIIGIQGFALLLCLSSRIFSRSRTLSQLYSQNVTMLSQGMGGASSMLQSSMAESDIASQEHQHAMAAEDLFRQFSGIFRRALDLQTRVRVVLYAELVKVFTECPALQESILKLMFQHYQKYYESNESVQPPLKLDLSLSRQRGMYEEPLQYLLHTMLHCYKELKRGVVDSDDEETMIDDIPATQAVGATQVIDVMQFNFSVLFERLKRCELSDFEFDKNATFSSDSELGETNQRMGVLVMGIFQVAINWSVSQPDHKKDSSSRDVRAEWETLLQFSQVCVWLKRKVQGTEGSQRQLQSTKKRKLTKMPMKLDTSKTSRTPTSSAWTRGKELGLSFEQSSNLQWATLIEPDSLLRILAVAVSKARGENGAPSLTLEEEELVLLIAEQGLTVLELIQSKMANERRVDGKISKRQSSDVTLRFQPDEFTQHLSDLFLRLLRIYCNEEVSLILPKGSTTRKRAANADVQSQERMRSIVQISVRGFARIVDMWSHRPLEEFEEQMTRALCLKSSSNEASPDYDVEGEESDSVACALPPLRKLVDDLLQQGMPDEANRLLDVVEIVWGKLLVGSPSVADTVLSQHVEWVKELLVERSGEASPRLLEKYVALLLRPSANASFRYDVAQQLAQGLRHASGGIDPDDSMVNAPAPEIQFHRVNEKQVLAIANAILANIDEALSETDRRVKVFDSEQRRHALKFKEDDLNALQQLEDETGSQIFRSETEGGHASRFGMFKTLCKQSFDLAGAIRPFVGLNLDNPLASIRIVCIAGRLFKLLVPLLRDKHRRKDASLPKFLRQLFDRVAGDLSQALLRFIQSIHSESTRSESKKSVSKSTAKRVTGKSKFIPDVVFQLEQFDLIMIKLSKLCKVSRTFGILFFCLSRL
jgi:hypothetical protein